MKKRIFALVLALCLTFFTAFSLVSCGGDDTPDTPDDSIIESNDPQDSESGDAADTGLVNDEYPEDIAEDIF